MGLCLLLFYGIVSMGNDKKHREVITTTRVYNEIGNLVDAKSDIRYVEVDRKKK